ncbi:MULTISPECIES: DoxX family protein [Tsukamurella]|uniref:DoxX family protein n=2 Tax=Tsukamurella TaxID=2060 RepID=A0A5C5RXR5_9ACTN|nr:MULTISPECIES: DoxX family protein [Tsukamurella]NMD58526.1 DoxX family protein [Tsukamurella columbiensis]TWS26811.1 DoxX family protein [Tsukamurella conjunctivitidis]
MTATTPPHTAARQPRAGSFDATSVGLLLFRLFVGFFLMMHGAQKLFGWFNGPGLDATARGFGNLGLSMPTAFAWYSGIAEFGGGILVMAGLFTSAAAAVLTATMAGAAWAMASNNDFRFFNTEGGYEFPLFMGLMTFALTVAGPGAYSPDRGRWWDRPSARAAAAAVAVAGSALALIIS